MRYFGLLIFFIGAVLAAYEIFFWGSLFFSCGLVLIFFEWPSMVKIPSTYRGYPLRAEKNGYFIYSNSEVYSNWPNLILKDGSSVSIFLWKFEASRGKGSMFILDRSGKLVFPGKE